MTFREEELQTAKDRLRGWIDGEKIIGTGIGVGRDSQPCIQVFVRGVGEDVKQQIRKQLMGYPIEFLDAPRFEAFGASTAGPT